MLKIKHAELSVIEEAIDTGFGLGYVLDFSDRTFDIFFDEEFGIDIDDDKYRCNGDSKGKRLKTFLNLENGDLAAKVLISLWDCRASILDKQGKEVDSKLSEKYFKIVHRLQGEADVISTDAIDKFGDSRTLDELINAIQRDINAKKPQAALDRLHTYCMKKLAHLLDVHGQTSNKEEPLNSRMGKYVKILEAKGELQGISLLIMKSSITTFDKFNSIRNNKSFAHDNEVLGMSEAKFIFESISNVLRFIRSIEASRFGG